MLKELKKGDAKIVHRKFLSRPSDPNNVENELKSDGHRIDNDPDEILMPSVVIRMTLSVALGTFFFRFKEKMSLFPHSFVGLSLSLKAHNLLLCTFHSEAASNSKVFECIS